MSSYTAGNLIDLGFHPNDPHFKEDLEVAKRAEAHMSRKDLIDFIFEQRRKRKRQAVIDARTYSFEEAVGYLASWLGTEDDFDSLSHNQVCAMFKNAAACVECSNDGIGNRPESPIWQARVKAKEA